MKLDSHKCIFRCQHVYDRVISEGGLGLFDGSGEISRSDEGCPRKGGISQGILDGCGHLQFWLEPVVDEEKGGPIARVTIRDMVQERELSFPEGLGFGEGLLF